ncbi:nicotinate-nucleotide--dimethylbenzimidazole phosphoribosyltransferase [Paracoccus sp. Z330]|uniref:Nicotinate-nucleotide--dimethylbenzimidazole phosphoribosyltransferase n=1 Tax=Paracoccus onchidii TaxID=3017813 RepID=A0ABT4ZIK1_9RHOB|nr:nicotinate-nucleotide--dimethylbenzimidazole phosphoribosyltransferase [Paracoccus onchidii]MDB6179188.1 nicotinate-nucleotide--dimethylbenzimidazole phosphoribosyltransferase [Paracoccus onchidii]
MRSFDHAAAEAARARQNSLTKPEGSLGRLEDMVVFLAGWQGRARPRLDRVQAVIFAGNHGVVAQAVNPFPQSVTAQMVQNFRTGGAAINQICKVAWADLDVVPLELDRPTRDFTRECAMTAQEVQEAMHRGAEAVSADSDLILLGEMGIGNSTVAAALAASVYGGGPDDWVGPGTGAQGDMMSRKRQAVADGLARHQPGNGADTLAAFGGREQAAICGAILRARELGIPVILDGFICCAAAAVLTRDDPDALAHCLLGHESAEPGHQRLVAALAMTPILSLDMRLGEGSGAAMALMILRGALSCHNGMATFAEAGIG